MRKKDQAEDVHVQASIHVKGVGEKDDSYGGQIRLHRIRGKRLISLSAYGAYGNSVDVDPAKLRDALDKLVAEDLGK